MDWYAEEYGNFTYYQDWSGFNVPSTELEPFYAGRFDPLSGKEERLLGMFRNVRGRFYMQRVIAQAIADHEAAKAKTAKGTRGAVSST